jgi:hypothetical protein
MYGLGLSATHRAIGRPALLDRVTGGSGGLPEVLPDVVAGLDRMQAR